MKYFRVHRGSGESHAIRRADVLHILSHASARGTDAEGMAAPDDEYAERRLTECERRAQATGKDEDVVSSGHGEMLVVSAR